MIKRNSRIINKNAIRVGVDIRGRFGLYGIDMHAFILGKNNKVRHERDFVFYNNPHSRTGRGFVTLADDDRANLWEDGPQQSVIIQPQVPDWVDRVLITLSADRTGILKYSLAQLRAVKVRVFDWQGNETYDTEFSYNLKAKTAMSLCAVRWEGGRPHLQHLGDAYRGGLPGLIRRFFPE